MLETPYFSPNDSATLLSTQQCSGALTIELSYTPRHHAALADGKGPTLLDWKCGVIVDEVPHCQRSSQQKPADVPIQPELQFWASWGGKLPRRRRHFEGDSAHPARLGSISSTVGLDAYKPTTYRACWTYGWAPCCCFAAGYYSVMPYQRYILCLHGKSQQQPLQAQADAAGHIIVLALAIVLGRHSRQHAEKIECPASGRGCDAGSC